MPSNDGSQELRDELLWAQSMGVSEEQEPERCPDCGGLGATVETYPAKDSEGYEFTAWRQKPCDTCHGTGIKP